MTAPHIHLQDREQDTGQVDGGGHGNAGQECAHHHQFRGKVFAVMEFHGVKHGIHCRRNGGHDEDGLAHCRVKGNAHEAPCVDEAECHQRPHDKAHEAAQPGIHITEGNPAPVNLHAQGNHDDGHQGRGTVLENRPEEGGSHVKAGILDGKHRHQSIDDGHMKYHGQGIPGAEPPLPRLVKAQGIKAHIHLHQHHGGCRTGHGQIGGLAIHNVGRIRKYQGNQGDTDISVIGKHGAVLESLRFGRGKAPHLSYRHADESQNEHEGKGQEEHVKHGHIQLGHINAVENEAGQHHIKGELGERRHVHMVAPVQEVADGHEHQKRQDIVGNNL